MSKRILLWVDDIRNPDRHILNDEYEIVWVKSYDEAIDFMSRIWPDYVCLDHDLGSESKSGYDLAKYIVGRCMSDGLELPSYSSQSSNPVGKKNILELFRNFEKFLIIQRYYTGYE